MRCGANFSNDRSYKLTRVPALLVGELFFQAPHRITNKETLSLVFDTVVQHADVYVWWNNRAGLSGLETQLGSVGFVPAGSGPSYVRPGKQDAAKTEMWAYHYRAPAQLSFAI